MVDLHTQYQRIKDEIDEAIQHVLASTAFIQRSGSRRICTGSGVNTPVQNSLFPVPMEQMPFKLQ